MDPDPAGLHALVVADGGTCSRAGLDASWPHWDAAVGLVVAADGGVELADELGLTVERWVGDGDSTPATRLAELEAAGVRLARFAEAKDESDTELAILEAIGAGATRITLLGALGGPRLDHALANIGLLAHPRLVDCPTRLLSDDACVSLVVAPDPRGASVDRALPGRVGDLVSLLPMGGGVTGVTTRGLRYPLRDEPLPAGPARGLSNVRDAADAGLTLRRGLLLVVETPATLAR
ncbi:MAG TPA: thiamine diphosphokinase [Candidatus Limnocylindrales bacterium]